MASRWRQRRLWQPDGWRWSDRSEAGTSREAVAGTEMPLEEVREDIAESNARGSSTVAPPAWISRRWRRLSRGGGGGGRRR